MKDGIETLLRPPLEIYSGICVFLSAFLVFQNPEYFLMTAVTGNILAAVLASFALFRFAQAFRIIAYKYSLQRSRKYSMRTSSIPYAERSLFLGKGFKWTAKHTQRIRDIKKDDKYMQSIDVTSSGNPALHSVGAFDGESDIFLDLSERTGHLLVFGKTRVGKTRFAEILIAQDIRKNNAVIVFDPKGDKELMERVYIESRKCGKQCYIFHLGYPDISVAYNPIKSFARITEVATRITSPLPSHGESLVFKEFVWFYVNIIANALVKLNEPLTLFSIRYYIFNIELLFIRYGKKLISDLGISWEYVVKKRKAHYVKEQCALEEGQILYGFLTAQQHRYTDDPTIQGLLNALSYSKEHFNKMTASLNPLLDKLMSDKICELLVPSMCNSRQAIDWHSVIEKRQVIYIGLDSLRDAEVASAVGAAIFADLTSVAGDIYHNREVDYQTIPVSIHADEINEIMQPQFLSLINKGGGAGFQIVGYTQTFSDLVTKLGSKDKAYQAIGNFSTLIMFQVKDLDTANLLVKQMPNVEVSSLVVISGSSDDSSPHTAIDFKSSVQMRKVARDVPLIEVNDITELPKGQCFCLMGGGKLYKLILPLPAFDSKDEALKKNMYDEIKKSVFTDAA